MGTDWSAIKHSWPSHMFLNIYNIYVNEKCYGNQKEENNNEQKRARRRKKTNRNKIKLTTNKEEAKRVARVKGKKRERKRPETIKHTAKKKIKPESISCILCTFAKRDAVGFHVNWQRFIDIKRMGADSIRCCCCCRRSCMYRTQGVFKAKTAQSSAIYWKFEHHVMLYTKYVSSQHLGRWRSKGKRTWTFTYIPIQKKLLAFALLYIYNIYATRSVYSAEKTDSQWHFKLKMGTLSLDGPMPITIPTYYYTFIEYNASYAAK